MKAQNLKISILQLAVQGKLVPQNSADEPASELIKHIETKKIRLINDGIVSIDARHTPEPITEEDVPYVLPDTWRWVKFADIATFYVGKTPNRNVTEYWNAGTYAWVSIADMVSDGITVETAEKITHTAFAKCFSNRFSPAGTMIMSFKLTIGKISYLGVDAVHNEAIISIFPFLDDKDLKNYLFRILPLIANYGDFKNAIKGKTLNATSLSNLMIPLPPLAEQRRIVTKLDELMPLVKEYSEIETQMNELNAKIPNMLRKSILQLAVQGKLVSQDPHDVPASEFIKRINSERIRLIKEGKISIVRRHTPEPITEEDIPYALPDNWCWVKFANVVSFNAGKTPNRHTSKYWNNGTYTWVSIADMVSDGITIETKEKITNTALTECFSNIFSSAGTMIMSFKLTIGKISYLGVDAVHNEAIISIIPFLDDKVFKDYLFRTLPLIANNGDFKNAIKGKTLNATSLSNLMIPLPPHAEQKRIVAKLDELLGIING